MSLLFNDQWGDLSGERTEGPDVGPFDSVGDFAQDMYRMSDVSMQRIDIRGRRSDVSKTKKHKPFAPERHRRVI